MSDTLRIGACQTPEILGDINTAVDWIELFVQQADAQNVDILLFPECFLQGYLLTHKHIEQHALNLRSPSFQSLLNRLAPIQQTLVLGLIERSDDKIFNSAVVIRTGAVIGTYRKTHLMPGETIFEPGNDYPIFELKGISYGINICYDTQFPEAAEAVAGQGAQVLFVPAQNMMRREHAEKWKYRHNELRAERVKETGLWLISADVTGEQGDRIGYGPTSIMNQKAEVIAQVPLMTTGMVVADIQKNGPERSFFKIIPGGLDRI